MRSFGYPVMFNNTNSNIISDHEATLSNLKLILGSDKFSLFGDPYFGLLLEHYMFDQNSYILRDAIADMIYTQLAIFLPQVKVNREDIRVIKDAKKGKVYCYFKGINQIDYQVNTFNLTLFENTEAIK